MWDDLTFGKKTKKEKRKKKKKRKISKKKKREKKSSPPKIHHHHLLVHTSRKRYANALSPSLSRKSRSVSFPRFLDARKRAVFLAFFFARDTHRTLSRERKGGGGSITRAKRTKKQPSSSSHQSVCLRVKSSRRRGHARRVWATRLERNARNECARTRFYRDRFRRSSRNGWVPASVEASSS